MPALTDKEKTEIQELLKEAESPEVVDRLSQWEQNFVNSVSEQFQNTGWLSPEKQIPKLKEIVEGRDARAGGERSRKYSRPSKLSYGSSHLERGHSGGFSGLSRKSDED
jgi:hypothetical protein